MQNRNDRNLEENRSDGAEETASHQNFCSLSFLVRCMLCPMREPQQPLSFVLYPSSVRQWMHDLFSLRKMDQVFDVIYLVVRHKWIRARHYSGNSADVQSSVRSAFCASPRCLGCALQCRHLRTLRLKGLICVVERRLSIQTSSAIVSVSGNDQQNGGRHFLS